MKKYELKNAGTTLATRLLSVAMSALGAEGFVTYTVTVTVTVSQASLIEAALAATGGWQRLSYQY